MMIVSIIVPSYNKGRFIQETIDSVRNQTYRDWELLIVDDGSTDNSNDIIEKNVNNDDRIKFFRRTELPSGGSVCRNIGLEKSSGDYIMFLDADDVIDKTCLEGRVKASSTSEKEDFFVFPVGTFYNKIGDSNSNWIPKGGEYLYRFLRHDLPWNTMSVLWTRNYIKQLGGFDIDYPRLQDVELHTRALLRNNVSFETYSERESDCFYRIDDKRTALDVDSQLKRQWKGVLQYLTKIGVLINNGKQKKALKGTLLSFITMLNYSTLVKTLNKELHKEIFYEIKLELEKMSMFSSFDIFYLKIYVFLYKKGFWRIKGFNYTMKKCF